MLECAVVILLILVLTLELLRLQSDHTGSKLAAASWEAAELELALRATELEGLVSEYRSQFKAGPIGLWRSFLDPRMGIGFDGTGLLGNTIEFRPDGTGTLDHYSRGETMDFCWQSTGDRVVAISWLDDDDVDSVTFDFFAIPSFREVGMRQVGRKVDDDDFWMAHGPLVLVGEATEKLIVVYKPNSN